MPAEKEIKKKRIQTFAKNISASQQASVLRSFFTEVTALCIFTGRYFKEVFIPPYEFRELARQCYLIGYKSFPLVAITGFIMGVVMTLQSRPTLAEFGAESWLPSMVAV